MHFCLYWYWPYIHEKSFKNIYTYTPETKVIKTVFLTSCSIFDKYIFFEEYFLMSCFLNKHIGLALEFVIYEFETRKKCQVSLVVKYFL